MWIQDEVKHGQKAASVKCRNYYSYYFLRFLDVTLEKKMVTLKKSTKKNNIWQKRFNPKLMQSIIITIKNNCYNFKTRINRINRVIIIKNKIIKLCIR